MFALAPFVGAAPKKSVAPAAKGESVADLARRLRPSVVVVSHYGRDGKQDGVGAGFVISPDGLIATCAHVIGEARPITVRLANGREHDVTEVHAWDRNLDLAIVRIDATKLQALALADSDQLSQGAPVVAMGNPLGMDHSVVQGVVSARREFEHVEMIQLAMPIEPGNSGGPLVDMEGRVHGLLTLKAALSANLGFATPINELKKLIARPNPVPMKRWLTIGALNAREWEPLMGARWQQRGGALHVDGMGQGFGGRSLCLSQKPLPDRPYEVGVRVRLDDEAGAAGLVFAADGKHTHYGFYPTAGQLRLTRFEGPSVYSWTILSTTNSGHYRSGDWNDLRVRVETNKLLCYVNDQLVIESGDTALKNGRVGLAKFRQTKAEFREFRLGAKLDSKPSVAPELADLLGGRGDLPEDALQSLLKTNAADVSRALNDEASRLEQRAVRMREIAKNAQHEATQRELVQIMTAPDSEIDLFHAALLVSKLDNPELDVRAYREQLDALAKELKASMPTASTNDERVRRAVEFLFAEGGFHGSRSDYYHRANSYIDRVMDDREGLPITLSVLFLELAQRVGVKHVSAAALPGRFMVLYNPAPGEERWIDVFDGGRLLNRAEVASVLRENNDAEVETDYLTTASKKEIVIRMLRNLANVAERNQQPRESLRYLDAVVALAPEAPLERLGRAMARIGAGDVRGAREDLRVVIDSEPDGVDVRRVEDLYRRLERTGE
jgi:regulator of sirC expression with transglutaminase-like and TPR domain